MKRFILVIIVCKILSHVFPSLAASPTAQNYRGVIQGIQYKFDRDWSNLNPQGVPAPGVLATLETFLSGMNSLGITGPGNYQFQMDASSGRLVPCQVVGGNCQQGKILVRNSIHTQTSTLFGVQQPFQYDVIVWSNSGQGYSRFLEGYFTPVPNTVGKGNITLISCSGCSTVGHSSLEWDGTGSTYHLRGVMYDTRFVTQNPQVYGGAVVDAQYSPLTGDFKLAAAANNVCDSAGIGDSICGPNGSNDHTTGYAAIVHANTLTGNVYIEGLQGTNNSNAVPTVGAMCILANRLQDVSGAACHNDNIDNFNGVALYSPSSSPASWNSLGGAWPLPEITDTPTF